MSIPTAVFKPGDESASRVLLWIVFIQGAKRIDVGLQDRDAEQLRRRIRDLARGGGGGTAGSWDTGATLFQIDHANENRAV
jgi:hypothetical protein